MIRMELDSSKIKLKYSSKRPECIFYCGIYIFLWLYLYIYIWKKKNIYQYIYIYVYIYIYTCMYIYILFSYTYIEHILLYIVEYVCNSNLGTYLHARRDNVKKWHLGDDTRVMISRCWSPVMTICNSRRREPPQARDMRLSFDKHARLRWIELKASCVATTEL